MSQCYKYYYEYEHDENTTRNDRYADTAYYIKENIKNRLQHPN